MRIKLSRWLIVAAALLSAVVTFASRRDEVTLVMVPRDEASVKLGMDIANRYPSLLLSYQLAPSGGVSLHGWTGTQWVNVTVQDFQDGNFFRTGPDSAVVVEKEGVAVPESIVPPAEWAPLVYKVTTTKVRPLLHLLGKHFDFKYKDWKWFSTRYNLPMESINPNGLNMAWYHKPLKEHFASQGETGGFDDLQCWVAIRHPVEKEEPEAVVEPVEESQPEPTIEPTESEDSSSADQPDTDELEKPDADPFTNAVPEAMVLGAGDADEVVDAEKGAPEAKATPVNP
jgi:hypothetical protein